MNYKQNLVNVIFIKEKYSIWDMSFQKKKGEVVEPTKIRAIMEWPVPKDVHDTISCMGLTRYYHIFMQTFF